MKRYRQCFAFIVVFSVLLLYGCSTGNKIQRINNKPEDMAPLVGTAINEGIKLVGKNTIYIVKARPEFKVFSYPHPRTEGDKIIIDKSTNILYLYKNGELYKTYPVATGRDSNYTPEGNFKIANKVEDHGEELKPQLGVRWMGLSVPREKDKRAYNDKRAPAGHKYGIHGTDEPESIGKHASGGCIRMDNRQVVELFELVEEGTPVEIR